MPGTCAALGATSDYAHLYGWETDDAPALTTLPPPPPPAPRPPPPSPPPDDGCSNDHVVLDWANARIITDNFGGYGRAYQV